MFKSKYTQWVPLGNYNYGGTDYITLCRKHKKTGMLYFKTKRVNCTWSGDTNTNPILPSKLIDVSKQWELIINL